jgi:holo-[acyl-carrier protein] synthase
VIGIGVDAVDTARFRRVLARRPRLEQRLFTDAEQATAHSRADPVPALAGRFAAKEAAMKAMGVGLGGFGWHDVEVARDVGTGAPSLIVRGRAATRAGELGISAWKVSITHTGLIAAAVVVAL